jgi:hypothetical protein
MKRPESPASVATANGKPANGTHRSAKKSSPVSKRSAARASDVAPEVLAAPFAGISIEPIDAPMWPIHPPGWFQPEAAASAPSWSGLTIERRHRIPAPGLLHFPLAPFDRPEVRENRREALLPASGPVIPDSGLEPLGWDPRAFSPKKELK